MSLTKIAQNLEIIERGRDPEALPRPRFTGTIKSIIVQGTAAQKSSVDLDGLQMGGGQIGGALQTFRFLDYFEITKLDNLNFPTAHISSYNYFGPPSFYLANCAHGIFPATMAFHNLTFDYLPYYDSIEYDTTTCTSSTMPALTISGSGRGYGSLYESDSNNLISWDQGDPNVCTWTGTNSSTWTDPGNWSNCANVNGYPGPSDEILVPATPNQPTVTGDIYIAAVALGTGGGTVTIATGANLFIGGIPFTGSINSNLNFRGDAATCSTCSVYLWDKTAAVANGATLGLGTGITVYSGGYQGLTFGKTNRHVGDYGSLKTIHNSSVVAEWPSIKPMNPNSRNALIFVGKTTAQSSSIDVNGLKLSEVSTISSWTDFTYLDYWNIVRFDNVIIDSSNNTDTLADTAITIGNCPDSLMGDKNWDGIDFVDGYVNPGKNISINGSTCTSLPGGGVLEMTDLTGGTNTGYGAAYESDPNGLIQWN